MSKEKQQTAVEWLGEKLNGLIMAMPKDQDKINEIFKQAKEMEKQQIKIAFIEGDCVFYTNEDPEGYYNNKYGK